MWYPSLGVDPFKQEDFLQVHMYKKSVLYVVDCWQIVILLPDIWNWCIECLGIYLLLLKNKNKNNIFPFRFNARLCVLSLYI